MVSHGEDEPYNFQSYNLSDPCLKRGDTQICERCPEDYYRDSLEPLNGCMKASDAMAGWGPDLEQKLIVRCTEGCEECRADHQKCTRCNYFASYLLDGEKCISADKIPSGKGRNWGQSTVEFCTASGCVDCAADFRECKQCNPEKDFWLDSAASTCIKGTDIPKGKGKNLKTFALESCLANCIECKDNFKCCSECSRASDFWLDNKLCVKGSDIQQGKGRNLQTGGVQNCISFGCQDCLEKHDYCSKCEA